MRWLTEQGPPPRYVVAGNGCGDVLRRIPEINRVNLRFSVCGQQAWTERKYTPPIRCGGLGEYADDLVGVFVCQLLQCDELRWVVRHERRRRESKQDGTEECDAFDLAGVRVGSCEDWLEDAGEVEGVEGRGEGGCDYRASFGKVVFR
jgi:hypothetical protein